MSFTPERPPLPCLPPASIKELKRGEKQKIFNVNETKGQDCADMSLKMLLPSPSGKEGKSSDVGGRLSLER